MRVAPGPTDEHADRAVGSILLLVLFVCLSIAVVVQTLVTVTLCAEGELVDEAAGRQHMAEKDRALAALGGEALVSWEPRAWGAIDAGEGAADGQTVALPGSEWVMQAEVRQDQAVSTIGVSAWLERGRDGVDLPLAALVAGRVDVDPSRGSPWLDSDGGSGADQAAPAVAYACLSPDLSGIAAECSVEQLASAWRLDPGWQQLGSEQEDGRLDVAPDHGVLVLFGRPGQQVCLATRLSVLQKNENDAGRAADSPLLVLMVGGADLDARSLGDLYAVLVVDDGSLWLDATVVHGAAFVTKRLDCGTTGRLLYSRALLRWATDDSLRRVRLVPGTRWEGTE
jgi:hypothetical protein